MNEQPIYEIPTVVFEGALEIQAGSPAGFDVLEDLLSE